MFPLLLAAMLAGCGDPPPADGRPWDVEPYEEGEDPDPFVLGPCEDPAPVLDEEGAETGFVRCSNGAVNRGAGLTWDLDTSGAERCEGTEDVRPCETDADCTHPANGLCLSSRTGSDGTETACGCTYACASDTDCGDVLACIWPALSLQAGTWAECVSAHCRTGDGCASGQCGLGSNRQLACRADADEGASAADCVGHPDGSECQASAGRFVCFDGGDA